MKTTYQVVGMTCDGCRTTVEKALNQVSGVYKATVSLETGEAVVEMQYPIDIALLQSAVGTKYTLSTPQLEKNVFGSVADFEEKKSKLQQLTPLFLIIGYIAVASLLLNLPWNGEGFMLDFMGLFFIVFSFFKMLDLKGFPDSFRMYDPLAKALPLYAWLYPFVETALGLLFLFRVEILTAVVVTLIILSITTVGVVHALFGKKTIQCACLGTALKLPMTLATFIENAIMIVMGLFMLMELL